MNFTIHVNTPNFCYLVGLICTDGHIQWPGCTKSSHMYRCLISQHKKEQKLLENIQKCFGGKIYKLTKSQMCWSIGGKEFTEYLRDIVGITNNKSLSLNVKKWFDELSEENKKHFIRGVLDGDGSISCIPQKRILKSGTMQLYLTKHFCVVSGSQIFTEMLLQYFLPWKATFRKQVFTKEKYPNMFFRKDGTPTTLFKVSVYGENAVHCLETLYSSLGNYLHMQRKILLYKRMKSFSQCENKKQFIETLIK